jgi:hypothetical protein
VYSCTVEWAIWRRTRHPTHTHTHTHTRARACAHTHTHTHAFIHSFIPPILLVTLLLSTDLRTLTLTLTLLLSTDTYEREALTRFWGVPSDDDGVRGVDGVDGVDVNDEGEWAPLERVPPRDPLTNEVLSSRVHFTNWGKRREVQAS